MTQAAPGAGQVSPGLADTEPRGPKPVRRDTLPSAASKGRARTLGTHWTLGTPAWPAPPGGRLWLGQTACASPAGGTPQCGILPSPRRPQVPLNRGVKDARAPPKGRDFRVLRVPKPFKTADRHRPHLKNRVCVCICTGRMYVFICKPRMYVYICMVCIDRGPINSQKSQCKATRGLVKAKNNPPHKLSAS